MLNTHTYIYIYICTLSQERYTSYSRRRSGHRVNFDLGLSIRLLYKNAYQMLHRSNLFYNGELSLM